MKFSIAGAVAFASITSVLAICAYFLCAPTNEPVSVRGQGDPIFEISADVATALQQSLSCSQDVMYKRIHDVEELIKPSFASLPKTRGGWISQPVARSTIASYFARGHGLRITGLKHHGRSAAASVHELGTLQDYTPEFAKALEAHHDSHEEFSLREVAAVIVALEYAVLDHPGKVLDDAFALGSISQVEILTEAEIEEVIHNYVMLMWTQSDVPVDGAGLQKMKLALLEDKVTWDDALLFAKSTVLRQKYHMRDQWNPFANHMYRQEEAVQLISDVSRGYGRWQQASCHRLKAILMANDPDRSGRVPLHTFYKASAPEKNALFQESKVYLAKTGQLDISTASSPKVLVANYVLGPSNCVDAFQKHKVCCLNECEQLMASIEAEVQAPLATPERLMDVMANISGPSTSLMQSAKISKELAERLESIASASDVKGMVHLHGRLFAQWLHYAFPYECPFPSAQWENAWRARPALTSDADTKKYVELSEKRNLAPYATRSFSQWNDREVAKFEVVDEEDVEEEEGQAAAPSATTLLRVVFAAVAIGAMLYTIFQRVRPLLQGEDDAKKPHVSRKFIKKARKEAKKDEPQPPARPRKSEQHLGVSEPKASAHEVADDQQAATEKAQPVAARASESRLPTPEVEDALASEAPTAPEPPREHSKASSSKKKSVASKKARKSRCSTADSTEDSGVSAGPVDDVPVRTECSDTSSALVVEKTQTKDSFAMNSDGVANIQSRAFGGQQADICSDMHSTALRSTTSESFTSERSRTIETADDGSVGAVSIMMSQAIETPRSLEDDNIAASAEPEAEPVQEESSKANVHLGDASESLQAQSTQASEKPRTKLSAKAEPFRAGANQWPMAHNVFRPPPGLESPDGEGTTAGPLAMTVPHMGRTFVTAPVEPPPGLVFPTSPPTTMCPTSLYSSFESRLDDADEIASFSANATTLETMSDSDAFAATEVPCFGASFDFHVASGMLSADERSDSVKAIEPCDLIPPHLEPVKLQVSPTLTEPRSFDIGGLVDQLVSGARASHSRG